MNLFKLQTLGVIKLLLKMFHSFTFLSECLEQREEEKMILQPKPTNPLRPAHREKPTNYYLFHQPGVICGCM